MAGPVPSSLAARTLPSLAGLAALLVAGAAFWLTGRQQAASAPVAALAMAALAAALVLPLAAGLARRMARARPEPPQTRDALTGLPAHAGFRERLDASLALARRQGWKSGVLVLDLRHFREVNEAHGRAGGDLALRLVAARLREAVRREDIVARLGADRFAVVQTALQDPGGALQLAERIVAALAPPLPIDGASPTVTADIGIAIAPDDGDEAGLLLARAEDALTAARAAPLPSIHCFAPGQEAALRDRRRLERELREAIAAGALTLHWQPQRRLSDRSLIGFEALVRWPHPERGMITPDDFIPLAEASGLIVPLGAWVLRAATAEAATWPGGLKVAVNLSAAQVRAEGLLATVADALAESGLPPHRLELEVTESLLLREDQHSAGVLAGLQDLGVSISLDDFGTGWSSLAYLRRFPFDQIKMDRAFLRDLGADPRVGAVVNAILSLGRGLGMTVVAEGIETEEQAQRLLALGCERGQGWHLGRPAPAEQARKLVAAEMRHRTPTAA
ncbi:putative bifunctional diguanylate cyclase/phosphodiesterase [Falsiroseomonas sp.]|uniref:putative bifunctional diguanylate cyclase/phosphodiesterase n=1 Tax=Falsiroseomonas sp. TaxID=2870721 RepID=UPI0034A2575B